MVLRYDVKANLTTKNRWMEPHQMFFGLPPIVCLFLLLCMLTATSKKAKGNLQDGQQVAKSLTWEILKIKRKPQWKQEKQLGRYFYK